MNHRPIFEMGTGARVQETRPRFNMAMVYDDRIAATRAMNVLGLLIREFGDEFEFQCDLWRFDALGLPAAQEAAVRSGDAAHLMIVSARGGRDLPAPLKDWLEKSVAGKAPGSAALTGLLESRRGRSRVQGCARQYLRSAAERSLMDFFPPEVDRARTSPD